MPERLSISDKGQGPIILGVDAVGGCFEYFSLANRSSFLSPIIWEMAWYRQRYCLKDPLDA